MRFHMLSAVALLAASGIVAALPKETEPTPKPSTTSTAPPPPSAQPCVAVGNHGAIVRSSDGGASWSLVSIPSFSGVQTVTLTNVTAPSLHTFYVVGLQGVVLRSLSDGRTWEALSAPPQAAYAKLLGVASDGGQRLVAVGASHTIYYSTNAGGSWAKSDWSQGLNVDDMRSVVHAGGTRFVAVGDSGYIAVSTDGGAHWTKATQSTPTGCDLHKIVNLGNGRLVAAGGGGETGMACQQKGDIQISTDNGNTWTRVNMTYQYMYPGLAADTSGNLIAVGGTIGDELISTNSGASWTRKNISTATQNHWLRSVTWNAYANAWIALGPYGFIIRSKDRGETWTRNTALPQKDGSVVTLVEVACSR